MANKITIRQECKLIIIKICLQIIILINKEMEFKTTLITSRTLIKALLTAIITISNSKMFSKILFQIMVEEPIFFKILEIKMVEI